MHIWSDEVDVLKVMVQSTVPGISTNPVIAPASTLNAKKREVEDTSMTTSNVNSFLENRLPVIVGYLILRTPMFLSRSSDVNFPEGLIIIDS